MGRWGRGSTLTDASAPTGLPSNSTEAVPGGDGEAIHTSPPCLEQQPIALPSALSGPLRDYEDKLKAIELRGKGREKAEIARLLGRSEHWVGRWWRQAPQLIPRPAVHHSPVVANAPLQAFRDLQLWRGWASGDGGGHEGGPSPPGQMFQKLRDGLDWQPARRATRDPDTGALRIRFDPAGRSMTQVKRHVAEYLHGSVPELDRILQRTFEVASICETRARVFANYYEDGEAVCPSHRHDFWTCMLSFGASRTAVIEDQRLHLGDGDMLLFGTQSHGLPAMPAAGGRISIVVFFHPGASSIERRWATLEGSAEEASQVREAESAEAHDVERADSRRANTECAAAGRLVDSDLLGCPGISMGFYGRARVQVQHPVKLYTAACGSIAERDFFGLLEAVGVQEVWDLRATVARCAEQWSPDALCRACRPRFLRYVRVPLGRRDAGGVTLHLSSDEGRDTLARMVQLAAAGRVVVAVGAEEPWRQSDLRSAVAARLVSGCFGPVKVIHICSDGSTEEAVPDEGGYPLSAPAAGIKARQGARPGVRVGNGRADGGAEVRRGGDCDGGGDLCSSARACRWRASGAAAPREAS